MPKEFVTERDIEDMVRRGILSLQVNDNVVLTDMAYEKAKRLGVRLVREGADNPPGAPVRPYISQVQPKPAVSSSASPPAAPSPTPVSAPVPAPRSDGAALQERIRSAVVARLGNQVDAKLLDAIIKRVIQSTGVK